MFSTAKYKPLALMYDISTNISHSFFDDMKYIKCATVEK